MKDPQAIIYRNLKESSQRATDVQKEYVDIKESSFKIAIDHKKKEFNLSIRGTKKTWRDWVRNFDLRSIDGYKRHAWKAAHGIWRYIISENYLNSFKKYTKKIEGHSQGGPEIGTFYKEFCEPGVDWCFMYDSPPFMKKHVCLGDRAFVIVNDKSIIRNLGFITFNQPACHWWYLDANGKIHTGLSWKEMRAMGRKQQGSATELLGDHPMDKINNIIQNNDWDL